MTTIGEPIKEAIRIMQSELCDRKKARFIFFVVVNQISIKEEVLFPKTIKSCMETIHVMKTGDNLTIKQCSKLVNNVTINWAISTAYLFDKELKTQHEIPIKISEKIVYRCSKLHPAILHKQGHNSCPLCVAISMIKTQKIPHSNELKHKGD